MSRGTLTRQVIRLQLYRSKTSLKENEGTIVVQNVCSTKIGVGSVGVDRRLIYSVKGSSFFASLPLLLEV